MTLLSDTAYHSFIGEVGALNTTTIRRLTRSRRHQLLAIALHRALQPVSASWRFGMGSLSALVLDRWLGEAGDRPNKADHFAGDRGGGHNAGLAQCGQPAVPRTQPDLRFPCNIANLRRQWLETV